MKGSILTFRQSLSPLVRKTPGFSKKVSHLQMQADLFQVFYNFARPHLSLRIPPDVPIKFDGCVEKKYSLRIEKTAFSPPVFSSTEIALNFDRVKEDSINIFPRTQMELSPILIRAISAFYLFFGSDEDKSFTRISALISSSFHSDFFIEGIFIKIYQTLQYFFLKVYFYGIFIL